MLSKFSINQRMIILVARAGSIAGLIAITLWTQQRSEEHTSELQSLAKA
jgi:flagellar biosynthesis/type III secretory pathway M-ring protein FliF/YscJ